MRVLLLFCCCCFAFFCLDLSKKHAWVGWFAFLFCFWVLSLSFFFLAFSFSLLYWWAKLFSSLPRATFKKIALFAEYFFFPPLIVFLSQVCTQPSPSFIIVCLLLLFLASWNSFCCITLLFLMFLKLSKKKNNERCLWSNRWQKVVEKMGISCWEGLRVVCLPFFFSLSSRAVYLFFFGFNLPKRELRDTPDLEKLCKATL